MAVISLPQDEPKGIHISIKIRIHTCAVSMCCIKYICSFIFKSLFILFLILL